jgi:hypothetical protein
MRNVQKYLWISMWIATQRKWISKGILLKSVNRKHRYPQYEIQNRKLWKSTSLYTKLTHIFPHAITVLKARNYAQ